MQALKRIKKELELINKDDEFPEYIVYGPIDANNMFDWEATIIGPENSPYEGGILELSITFPKDFPFKPPKVAFKTPIIHPNVCLYNSSDVIKCTCAGICLDILHNRYSPSITLKDILLDIYNLLAKPSFQEYYILNSEYSESKAREWTEKYAK